MTTKKRTRRTKKDAKSAKSRARALSLPEYDDFSEESLKMTSNDWSCDTSCDDLVKDETERASLFSCVMDRIRKLELLDRARDALWHVTRPNSIACGAVAGTLSAAAVFGHVFSETQLAALVSAMATVGYVLGNLQGRRDGRW